MPIDQNSYKRHNQHYVTDALNVTRSKHAENTKNKVQYRPDNPIGEVVDNISPHVKIAVDIGAGHGWGANYLSQTFDKVYAIEPSEAAINLGKAIYPNNDKIVWMHGFAEDELNKLSLPGPAVFYCACVLSHLSNEAVEAICKSINDIAKPGSIVSLAENWGKTHSTHLWYSRSKDWWEKQFPDWDLSFRDTRGNISGMKKGIVGLRKK